MLTRLLTFLFLFITIITSFAQENSHQAVIWRGFSHSWTYNHRINRLGDYATFNQGTPATCHASASGLGADSTTFTSFFSLIESPQVHFQEGVIPIKLYGREKQLITKNIEVAIPANDSMRNLEQYVTLLNGFDLQAIGNADKLQLLRISVEDGYYAPAVNEIRFNVKVAIVVNCQSFECSRFNQKSTYDLKIYYLIAAADRDYMASTSRVITESYPWDKKIEYQPNPKQHSFSGSREQTYKDATVGIQSMAITLDEAHWTVQYNSNITPLNYFQNTGRAEFSVDLFFQEWQQGMKQLSAKPEHSKFSSKKKGWCLLDMEVVLLQFSDAKIIHKKHEGTLFWEGQNASPNNPKAVSSCTIDWDKWMMGSKSGK